MRIGGSWHLNVGPTKQPITVLLNRAISNTSPPTRVTNIDNLLLLLPPNKAVITSNIIYLEVLLYQVDLSLAQLNSSNNLWPVHNQSINRVRRRLGVLL